MNPTRKSDCKTAFISEKCVSSEAVTHARLAVSLIGDPVEKTIPDSKNFCGYVSCIFFDRFSNNPTISGVNSRLHEQSVPLEAFYPILDLIFDKSAGVGNKLAEYYNPTPVSVLYRGHKGKLFKRDFAGEMLDKYNDLNIIDY